MLESSGKSWSEEEDQLVRVLWEEGLTASQVAARLDGRTRNAVIGRVSRLKLPQRVNQHARARAAMRTGWHARKLKVKKEKPQPTRKRERKTLVQEIMDSRENHLDLVRSRVEVEVPVEQRGGVADLRDDQCRWPIGHVGEEGFHFCHHVKAVGLSYCKEHVARAYQAPRVDTPKNPLRVVASSHDASEGMPSKGESETPAGELLVAEREGA